MSHYRLKIPLLILSLLFLVSACKVELYSNLSEKEANEMLAILMEQGIDIDKLAGKEMTYALLVDKKHMARSVETLREAGYPRDQFISIGDVFKKEGLVSSPLEERVRFIYALSQEISKTLSEIDGVLAARVHVVIPENNPLSDSIIPSSAAVFIKHRQDSDVAANIPGIKKLVVNSIEGLAYDKVTVILFESEESVEPVKSSKFKSVLSVKVAGDSVVRFWILTGGLILLLVASMAVIGYLLVNAGRNEKEKPGGEGV